MRLFRFRREPTDPAERADRFWNSQRYRVVAGVSVGKDFATMSIAVLRGRGQGKYLAFEQIAVESVEIPGDLSRQLDAFQSASMHDVGQLEHLAGELALVQSEWMNRVRIGCGKLGQQISVVTIDEPGIWRRRLRWKAAVYSFLSSRGD